MKLNVAVFYGGESVEHEVSIISAHQAMNALNPEKYNVLPIYISKDQKMYYSEQLRDMNFNKNLKAVVEQCPQITIVNVDNKIVIQPVKKRLFGKNILNTIDLAIPVMHGTNGEDGTIQGFLEMMRIPYAGCDVIAAGVGQDKVLQKNILHDNGLPITNWFWVYASEIDEHPEEVLRKAHKLIYPVILKPARTGSSVGISIAHNDEEYLACFEDARQYDEKIITEKVVKPMREINCSVLGTPDHIEASVLEEVNHNSDDELLDFEDKYMRKDNNTKQEAQVMASTARIVPAPISEEATKTIQAYAIETFRVLGASGVCRIDFLMDAETNTIYINEINTIPGSLAFYLWQETNKTFAELMDALVDIALEKERKRSHMTYSYETNLLESYTSNGAKGIKK